MVEGEGLGLVRKLESWKKRKGEGGGRRVMYLISPEAFAIAYDADVPREVQLRSGGVSGDVLEVTDSTIVHIHKGTLQKETSHTGQSLCWATCTCNKKSAPNQYCISPQGSTSCTLTMTFPLPE